MKKIYSLFLSCVSISVYAQPGSVELKDGSGVSLGTYASISSAYAAIPATLTQAYLIETGLTYNASSETYPIIFMAKTGASSSNTITLRPAAGVASQLIQGNIAGNAILILDDADYVIIDGRAGGVGPGVLSFSNLATSSNSNTLVLRNGACFNQVRYCTWMNGTTSLAGRGVQLSTSAANPTGNSDNLFEYCHFPSGRYQFNSNGTAANPNTRNTIYGCNFRNMIFVGVWGQAGTGKLVIDSCTFSCNMASGDGLYFGILFDSQNDTVRIVNNHMYNILNGSSGTLRYIHIRSTLAGGNNFTYIENNFLSMMTGNNIHTNVAGIEYSGSNPTRGRIAHNTIRIGSTLTSGGTSGNVGSSALLIATSSPLSTYEIKNNIFINERSGGTTGLQHVAFAATNISATIDIDHNTYNSGTGSLVRWGTMLFTDIASYQAIVPGGETNANDFAVQLVSDTDLHLTGTSLGELDLEATPLTGITDDIDGDIRGLLPYRGADEALPALVPPCTGIPDPGTIVADADSLCTGDTVNLFITGLTGTGLTLQWESSTDGISFSPIPLATGSTHSQVMTQTTWFRVVVFCTASGLSNTTDSILVWTNGAPSGGSIFETHSGYNYLFSVTGMTPGDYTYAWDFGDATGSTLPTPTHTYASSTQYTVTLIVSNACGSDTLNYLVDITVGVPGINGEQRLILFPNPTSSNFTIDAQVAVPLQNISITDMSGRVVWARSQVNFPLHLRTKDLELDPGVYLVKTGEVTLRLVVQ